MNTPFTTSTVSSFVRSKLFAGIVSGIGIMLILFIVFEAGLAIGYHEALFSSRWGQNYSRNFGSPNDFPGELSPDPNGTYGKILSISSSTIVIANNQKPEQRIVLDSSTIIRDHENTIATSSLQVGDSVVVLGEPNGQGEILAKFIRVMPALLMMGSTSSMMGNY